MSVTEVKSCLVSAVGIAAVEETWATLRRKSVKLSGIDDAYGTRLSPGMCKVFSRSESMAHGSTRLIPLTAIVTPATLSVVAMPNWKDTELRVPTVNFDESFWYGEATFEGAGFIASPSPDISRLFTVNCLIFPGASSLCTRLSEAFLEVHGMSQALWDSEIENVTEGSSKVYSEAVPSDLNNTLFVWAAGNNPLWNDNATQPTELV
ncbi:hypothetical protein BDW75DRAFT_241705 [Aspergillus navahoensis]